MKKYLVLFVAFCAAIAFVSSASAQDTFKDVPEDHWAASAVYELIKLGVTRGYPDGTFRGNNKITRYETAMFISKLAKVIGTEDLKADIMALKNEVAALKVKPEVKEDGFSISGGYMGRWNFGNLLAEEGSVRGTLANYRLMLSANRDLGQGANVKINLDTMDNGFMNDGSSVMGDPLAANLLDIESNVELDLMALGLENPVNVKATYGPGPKQHLSNQGGVLPSELGVTYIRPRTSATASSNLFGADVSGGYVALGRDANEKLSASKITTSLGYTFQNVPLVNTVKVEGTADYISRGQFSSDVRDIRGGFSVSAPLTDKIEATTMMGLGGSDQETWMVGGKVAMNDVWDTGTVMNVSLSKVGAQFIDNRFAMEEFDVAGYDSFNRPLQNGTVNIGGGITQTVTEGVKLVGKGEIRLESDYKYEAPLGRLTAEGGISYAVAPNTTVDAIYRVHQIKLAGDGTDTSDVAALGLMYEF
jgi:hypothetical protein